MEIRTPRGSSAGAALWALHGQAVLKVEGLGVVLFQQGQGAAAVRTGFHSNRSFVSGPSTGPEEHCREAPELLAESGCSEEFIHAVCSHGYGLCSDVEPVHEMEKVLFAADELTGAGT